MVLLVRGAEPVSVFGLNGSDENSATYAVGWALERCPAFLRLMLMAWCGEQLDIAGATIVLQKHGTDGGFTDIEVTVGGSFQAILEAKKSWQVPTDAQLRRYQPRLVNGRALIQRLVSVSAADTASARLSLPMTVDGATVIHQSWNDIRRLAARAGSEATGFEEKLWLRHLIQHLREFVAVDRLTSNTVYVVSLGRPAMVEGGTHTWIDVVTKDRCYFHPVGSGWPVQPPNYIGFRYHGKLQSVHHIESFEVMENVASINPLWLTTNINHFVYRLGPPMAPPTEVRTGNLFRASRVYCAIDTLLSGAYKTISEARDETQRRLASTE